MLYHWTPGSTTGSLVALNSESFEMYLVVCDSLVDITYSSLGRVRICPRLVSVASEEHNSNNSPTGVMWHSTCDPSIPTQLNVE